MAEVEDNAEELARVPPRRICNMVRSPQIATDWRIDVAIASRAIPAPPAALPDAIDLREDWWEVGDQEYTGSCVGWASTDAVARYQMVKAGRLAADPEARLSPRFTWMASKETDEFVSRPETFIEAAGTSLKAAAAILRSYGAAPEELLPFHVATSLYPGDGDAFFATVAMRRIASYFNLELDLMAWRYWLAVQGPLLVAFEVDECWMAASDTGGMLDEPRFERILGAHAVAVVGYTADGRFILRNSWGKNWGDKGFAYASEAYIRGAFFAESYGFTV